MFVYPLFNLSLLTAMTTSTISSKSLEIIRQDWANFCLDRLMSEAFWSACDDFISDDTGAGANFSDEEKEAIYALISEQTRITVSDPTTVE